MNNPTCSQCDCVAGCQARERLCPNVEQPVDAAYQESVSLAKALFKEHYSNEPDYANGKSVWGVCDTTAGVISQIDNMVTGLSRKLSAISQPVPLAEPDDLTIAYMSGFADGKKAAPAVQPTPNIIAYMTSHDDGDMLFFDKEEARRYCEDDSEPEPLVLLSAIAQPVQPAANLERYITANYPNAEGDTLADRVIFALETMDIALGMKEIAQPKAQP